MRRFPSLADPPPPNPPFFSHSRYTRFALFCVQLSFSPFDFPYSLNYVIPILSQYDFFLICEAVFSSVYLWAQSCTPFIPLFLYTLSLCTFLSISFLSLSHSLTYFFVSYNYIVVQPLINVVHVVSYGIPANKLHIIKRMLSNKILNYWVWRYH